MGIQLHGMGDPLDMPFGLFPTLPQEHLIQGPAGDDRIDHFAVHGPGRVPQGGPSRRPLLLSGLKLKHRLTGYSHPFGQLLGGHSEGLTKRPDPPFARRLERGDFTQFFEPFFQLTQLNDAKSFGHKSLYGDSDVYLLAIHDE